MAALAVSSSQGSDDLAPNPAPQAAPSSAPPISDEISANPFLDAFFTVDKDSSETITSEELSAYMSDSPFENNCGEKWMKLFDENDDGTITLDEYCNVLGLNPKQARIYRLKKLKALCLKLNKLPDDVTCISATMDLEMQVDVLEVFRQGARLCKEEREIASHLKSQLDQQFGRLWHVVIVTGQYWASYSHEPGMAFFFKVNKLIVMVWRTPGM